MTDTRQVLTLRHEGTGRLVPIEVPTVIGRSDAYYRYKEDDLRGDRLRGEVADGLAALNYIKICSDSHISRIHGVVDPAMPSVCDLNTTNGTRLNGTRLPTRAGDAGPKVQLSHGDVVKVGAQEFAVEIGTVSKMEHTARVQRVRRGLVATDRARLPRAEELATLLRERKGFELRRGLGWAATIAGLYHLQEQASPEGLVVICLCAEAVGGSLLYDGEGMAFEKLLPLLEKVPGRKLVVLDVDGDPTVIESLFTSEAYEDMMLLTAPPPAMNGGSSSPLMGTLHTAGVEQVKKALSGDGAGGFDDARDGLDALIGPDTNVVNVDWLKSYRGRLKVLFGERPRADDEVLSHSMRFGSTSYRF